MPCALTAGVASAASCDTSSSCFGGLPLGPSRTGISTHFYQIKCSDGYKCVSKVAVFGLGHDGDISGPPKAEGVTARYNGAYEEGCPARGITTDRGECEDDGKGGGQVCFASDRMEVRDNLCEENSDNCLCVKPTSDGTTSVQSGQELREASYQVEAFDHCKECWEHDYNPVLCNTCKNCEYAKKTFQMEWNGKTREHEGCYDRDGGSAHQDRAESTEGRTILPTKGVETRKLTVVPHYPIWSPSDREHPGFGDAGDKLPDEPGPKDTSGMRLPYQSRRIPLGRDAWITEYKKTAPVLQWIVDTLRSKLTNSEWGRDPETLNCFDSQTDGGDDIAGKYEKAVSAMAVCRQMQEVAAKIAKGETFDNKVHGVQLRCQGGSRCEALNCYTHDDKLHYALERLKIRNQKCKDAEQTLLKEEKERGPPAPGDRVRGMAGRYGEALDSPNNQRAKEPGSLRDLEEGTKDQTPEPNQDAMPEPLVGLLPAAYGHFVAVGAASGRRRPRSDAAPVRRRGRALWDFLA